MRISKCRSRSSVPPDRSNDVNDKRRALLVSNSTLRRPSSHPRRQSIFQKPQKIESQISTSRRTVLANPDRACREPTQPEPFANAIAPRIPALFDSEMVIHMSASITDCVNSLDDSDYDRNALCKAPAQKVFYNIMDVLLTRGLNPKDRQSTQGFLAETCRAQPRASMCRSGLSQTCQKSTKQLQIHTLILQILERLGYQHRLNPSAVMSVSSTSSWKHVLHSIYWLSNLVRAVSTFEIIEFLVMGNVWSDEGQEEITDQLAFQTPVVNRSVRRSSASWSRPLVTSVIRHLGYRNDEMKSKESVQQHLHSHCRAC